LHVFLSLFLVADVSICDFFCRYGFVPFSEALRPCDSMSIERNDKLIKEVGSSSLYYTVSIVVESV